MAHHGVAGSSRIPSSRVRLEPFRHYPFRRLCCLVQQRHFSLGRQIPSSTSTKWATASRERRTIKVGPASRHLPRLFRKDTAQGQSYFTMISLRGNDMVAGDFNGAAWRRQSGNEHRPISTIEEASANTYLPFPPVPAPLWGPGGVPGEWADVCGFIKPPGSEAECHIRMQGAFKIPYDTLGIRCTDQSCHHEAWVHLLCGTRRTGETARENGTKNKERCLNVHVPLWEQVRTGASEDLCEI